MQTTGRDLQALGCCFQELLLQLAGGGDSGIARHEGDTAGIGAEIDRSERRVGGLQVNLLRLDTQFFGDDIGQHGRGALADVGAATIDGDAASTVKANLYGRVGHVVPVNRLASATDVRRGSQPQAAFDHAPVRRRGHARLVPAGARGDLVQAFIQRATGDAQAVDGTGVGFDKVTAAKLGGVETKVMGELVYVYFDSAAWLRCAVAALGAAWRLVGEEAHALKFIAGQLIRHRLEHAGVVGGCHAIRAVSPAIEEGTEMHGGERAILLDAGLDPHFDRVTPTVDEENLFARAGEFDRAAGAAREFAGANFVREGVGFPAKAAADVGGDYTHVGLREFEYLADFAVNVVRRLGRGPEGELAADGVAGVGFPAGDTGVRFQGGVVVALVVEPVLAGIIGLGKARLHVAKFIVDGFVDVAGAGLVVDLHLGMRQGLVDAHEGGEHFVFDLDQFQRFVEDIGVERGDGGNGVADVAHFVDGQRVFVLAGGEDAKFLRQVFAGEYGYDAGQF